VEIKGKYLKIQENSRKKNNVLFHRHSGARRNPKTNGVFNLFGWSHIEQKKLDSGMRRNDGTWFEVGLLITYLF